MTSSKIPITLLGILFFLFCWGRPVAQGETTPTWTPLSQGFSWLRWEVREGKGSPNRLIILKIDPALWGFRVFFNPEPKTITEWHRSTKAVLVLNGGFYLENFQPAGRIIVDGAFLGPPKNRYMKGMFLAEPRKGFEHLPKAILIDLKEENSEEVMNGYGQGIQSFPILLDAKGQVRVNPSTFQAHRTLVAQDYEGLIYFMITEKPFFTLYDLGTYLKESPFKFRLVLNLDGGNRTQMALHLNRFQYSFTGQGEGKEVSRLFASPSVKLPSVIGVFPRSRP